MSLPLEGYRILELGAAIASPYGTGLCGDLGAEVIKIETQRRPDNMRYSAGVDPAPNPLDGGLLFNGINRNKRGMTLDLLTPGGRELFLQMVRTADAVVENFSAGTMEAFGLPYSVLRRERPDLIMISLSGFGATGPYKDCVAYGIVLEGLAGMLNMEGYEGERPLATPFTYNDYIASLYGAHLLQAALYRRLSTGRGLYVDFAEAEISLGLVPQGILAWLLHQESWGRDANRDHFSLVRDTYPCLGDDAWIAINVTDGTQWQGLCRAIGRTDLAHLQSVEGQDHNAASKKAMDAAIADWTRTRTPEEAFQALQAQGVPAGPAYTLDQTLEDPHVVGRNVVTKDALHQYTKGRLVPEPPLRITGVPRDIRLPAPCWGQDNSYVVRDLLGHGGEEYDRLTRGKALS